MPSSPSKSSGRSDSAAEPAEDRSADRASAAGPVGFTTRLLGSPRLLLFLTLLLTVVAGFGLTRLRNEEDVLAFLPEGDAEVTTFKDVARRFGALRVALIGIEPKSGAELFSPELLGRITQLSESLKNTEGVDRVVSLSTMVDLKPSDFGVDVQPLLPTPLPGSPAELAALKAHVLTLPQIRGNVISADGRAGLVMVFFAEGAKTRVLSEKCRTLTQQQLGPVANLYFGGAPFAGQSIYDDTQKDVRKLTPLALLLFFGVVLLAFWDALPVLLTVVTVALSGLWVLGGMGLYGEPFTVITGTLPLILFASGSQYAIHVLGRYYLLRAELAPLDAARGALRIAGPPVVVAALNCCLGFLSFGVMNIHAMRTFGFACSIGALFCCVLSVSLLPAVVVRWQRGQQSGAGSHARFAGLGGAMWAVYRFARSHRVLVVTVSLGLLAVCGGFMTRVQVRMEPRAFFRPGSEPAEAQRFLDAQFGGAQFAQVEIVGDLTDPRALAELRRLGAFARSLPGVTQIQSLVQPLAMISEGMAGQRGLPQTQPQVGMLLSLMEGEPSLKMLLAADRKSALLHVRVLGEAQPVLASLQSYLSPRWPFTLRTATATELAEELLWLLPAPERASKQAAVVAAVARIAKEGVKLAPKPAPVPVPTQAPGSTDGDAATDEDAESVQKRAAQTVAMDLIAQALGIDAALRSQTPQIFGRPQDEIRAQIELVAAEAISPPQAPKLEGGAAVAAPLVGRLTGEPMLDQAFSRSVASNQWLSLAVATAAVLLVLLFAQRSLGSALLSALPAAMALVIVFGVLGFSGRPIDLGTSLVGSIVTSSGADFAMHYIWYLRRNPAEEAVRSVGPVIFLTAVLLGLGMGVLMLGASPPIKLFGGLACAGLLLSATFTFLLVPALLGKAKSDASRAAS